MANNAIKDFKNGNGFVYVTAADGTTIYTSEYNTPYGGKNVQDMLYTSAPLAGDIVSIGKVNLTGGTGTITAITVNGVNVLGSTTANGIPSVVAPDAVNKINTYTSSPDYKAILEDDTIIIQALVGTGSTPNTYVVAVAVTNTLTYTAENMSGGTNSQGLIDAVYGYRCFLNADYGGTATATSLTNSVEITKYLVNRGSQTSYIIKDVEILTGGLTIERESCYTLVNVQTEGSVAADTLTTINTEDFQEGDLIVIRATTAGNVVTISEGDNIYLANAADFLTGDGTHCIGLRYLAGLWKEDFRTPSVALTVAAMRAASIAVPVQGVNVNAMPTNGTVQFTPGTSKEYQVVSGSPNLVGAVVYEGTGSPLDGDHFWVKYTATPSTGVNTVTIFGITLTAAQASSGLVTVYAEYDLANATWMASIIQEANGVDFATNSPWVQSTGTPSAILAGSPSTVTGNYSVAMGYATTASGAVSLSGGSGPNDASGFASFIFSDNDGTYGPIATSTASGLQSTILGGRNCNVTANYSAAISAENSAVTGINSVALGTLTRTVSQASVAAVETIQIFGGIQKYNAQSSTGGTLDKTNTIRFVDSSGGNITETLPAAPVNGQEFEFIRAVSALNTITIDGNGKNINGAANYAIPLVLYDRVRIVYSLSIDAWFIMNK